MLADEITSASEQHTASRGPHYTHKFGTTNGGPTIGITSVTLYTGLQY